MTDATHSSYGIQIKRADVSEKGVFAGYASTFGNTDVVGDIVQTGAFNESLRQHKASGSMPGMLWAHDMNEPIGAWHSMSEDVKGLRVEGKLTLDIPRAQHAHALMRDGALYMSIGYLVNRDGAVRAGERRMLKSVELLEVSLTSVPANRRALVTSVKTPITKPEELQRALQTALGLSQRQAKRIVAGGWHSFAGDDDDTADELTGVLAELKRINTLHT